MSLDHLLPPFLIFPGENSAASLILFTHVLHVLYGFLYICLTWNILSLFFLTLVWHIALTFENSHLSPLQITFCFLFSSWNTHIYSRHTYWHTCIHTKTRPGESLHSVLKLSLCIYNFEISAPLPSSLPSFSSALSRVSFSVCWRASSFLTFFF